MVRPNIPIPPEHSYLECSQPKENDNDNCSLEQLRQRMISKGKRDIEYHETAIRNIKIALDMLENAK